MTVEELSGEIDIANASLGAVLIQPLTYHPYEDAAITYVGTDANIVEGVTIGAYLVEFTRTPTALSGATWLGLITSSNGEVIGMLLPPTAGGRISSSVSREIELPLPNSPSSNRSFGVIFVMANDSGGSVATTCFVHVRHGKRKEDE